MRSESFQYTAPLIQADEHKSVSVASRESSQGLLLACRCVGYADFRDSGAAQNAISIYNGWRGFGGSQGLALRVLQPTQPAHQSLKREREGQGNM